MLRLHRILFFNYTELSCKSLGSENKYASDVFRTICYQHTILPQDSCVICILTTMFATLLYLQYFHKSNAYYIFHSNDMSIVEYAWFILEVT